MYLVKIVLMAWALGMLIGYVTYVWIRAANDPMQHGSEMIQISLTLCCSYWSFIMAEGIFHVSAMLV